MFHMKQFTSKSQQIGRIGENIALKYLKNGGFSIIERNYTKKFGEIDIICRKDSVTHFIEVKTLVSHETIYNVSRETYDSANPFENITRFKLRKFLRTCEIYLEEKHVSRETLWVVDAIAIILDKKTRSAKVNILWNVIN